MAQFCSWVLAPASKGKDAEYCNKKVPWKIARDDDGNKVRKYSHFCAEHQEQADAQDAADE